jgi:hypothetical protein
MVSISTLSMADSWVEGKGKKVTDRYGILAKIMLDGREAYAAAIQSYNREQGTAVAVRQPSISCPK